VARAAGVSTTEVAAAPATLVSARIPHWVMAILILSMLPLGLVIANDWGGPLQEPLYDFPRSAGTLIIPLIFLHLSLIAWPIRPWPCPMTSRRSSSSRRTPRMGASTLIGTAIAGLVSVHIAGALFHHLVRKDRVLIRMVSG
jgi:cytochrome b561